MRTDCPLDPGALVWAYCRHSPGEKQTIDSQVKAVKDYCQVHRLILVHIFIDAARKGSTVVGRDEFLAMMEAARQEPRPVAGIVFWAFDRFFSGYDRAQFHKADLRLMGYTLISITEPLPSGPEGRLVEAAKDYVGEVRLARLSANVKRGLAYLKSLGCVTTGFPPVGLRAKKIPIGTRPNGETRYGRVWEPDPETWPLVRRAWEMRLEGYTLLEIHRAIPSFYENSSSWTNFFRNAAYRDAGACTPEEWEIVQAMGRPAREGGAYPRRKSSPYLLSSPDFATLCAYCNQPISGSKTIYTLKDGTHKEWPYYICSRKKRDWSSCEGGKALKAEVVERAVLETVLARILTPENISSLAQEVNHILSAGQDALDTKTANLDRRLAELEAAIGHLLDLVETDGFQAAEERLRQRRAERAVLKAEQARLGQCHRAQRITVDEFAVRAALAELCNALSPEDVQAAKRALGRFVERIVLSRDGGEIFYHLPSMPQFGNQLITLRKVRSKDEIGLLCNQIGPSKDSPTIKSITFSF